ncbi:Ergothioneine biosynthesis protein 1 [Pyricularia oryzae]
MPAAESAVLMAGGVGHPLKSFVGGFYGNENPLPKQKALNGWDLSHGKHNGINGSFGNKSVSGYAPQPPDIIDIRGVAVESDLKEEILSSFLSTPGQRAMPTILLYDQRGLQIFEEITYLEEYYLTNDEISVLESSASEIARAIPDGSMVVELGSGNLRKVNLLLQAIDNAGKSVDYYALDLSKEELKRTLAQVPQYKHVHCHGLLGTYDDGREWLKEPASLGRQKCVMSLGSSIGNFRRDEASDFLRGFSEVLRPGDSMIIGVDACSDPAKSRIQRQVPEDNSKGITHQFVLNGLVHANRILEQQVFKLDDWQVIGEYVYDAEGGRHQAWYSPVRDTWALGQHIPAGERVFVERSVKYSKSETRKLWEAAGMVEAGKWSVGEEYGVHVLTKPTTPFALTPNEYASTTMPTMEDWSELWAKWDAVTRGMLPKKELLEKPIRLRNACIFYLGHIPTFLDIQLTKTTKEPATRPEDYAHIFERGVDPDVDNPELCHSHSEIPDEWPPASEIAEYQERVRSRVRSIYSRGADNIPRNVARAIWVGFEHEVMHLETLLYMLLQSDRTLPPPGVVTPNFEKMAIRARANRVPNEWFEIPATEIIVGLDDPEDSTDPNGHFGWDNEKPQRKATVGAFQAKARPITNQEYASYMYERNVEKIPASWSMMDSKVTVNGTNGVNGHSVSNVNGHSGGNGTCTNGKSNGHANGHSNGHSNDHGSDSNEDHVEAPPKYFLAGKAVRTVFGLVPLENALDWPVFASYDELAGCASWMGGRIPTFEETKSIYAYAEVMRKKQAQNILSGTVPAVNGHLSNNGVEETPPSRGDKPASEDGAIPSTQADENLFIDLGGSNVGFQNWHPTAVTADGGRLAGQSQMGGVWEWTSSPLRRHEGFEPMSLYPNYTADFFDEKHNIILGGSWATHPRIAGRKSFVNWYQRNYPYAWAGARLVRDIKN